LSENLFNAAMFAKVLRQTAYANYMATQTALLGTDFTGYTIVIDTTDIDSYNSSNCVFPAPSGAG